MQENRLVGKSNDSVSIFLMKMGETAGSEV